MNKYHVVPNPRPHEPPHVLMNGDAIVNFVFEFLKNLHIRGVAEKTIRAYAFDLLYFYRFLSAESLTPDTFTYRDFNAFMFLQRRTHVAPRTINRRLTAVRSLLNSLADNHGDNLFGHNIPAFYKGIRNKALLGATRLKGKRGLLHVKVPTVLITPLTQAEVTKYFFGIRKYRDTAIVMLMIFCGLRSCEILSLTVNDIDLNDDQIRVRGKGGKERILPITPSIRHALQRYLDYERPEVNHSHFFVVLKGAHRGQSLTAAGLRTLFRHRRKILNIDAANPHKFRHTFCTNMIRQGVSLAVMQKLMGHSDIEVTMGYVHLDINDVAREYHQAIAKLQNSEDAGPKTWEQSPEFEPEQLD